MKSSLIRNILVMCTILMVFSRTLPIKKGQSPKRALQGFSLIITDAKVAISAEYSYQVSNGTQLNINSQYQQAIYAQSNASLAAQMAINTTIWANTTQYQLINLASIQSTLMVAQADVQIAQAALSQAKMYSFTYTPLNAVATLAASTQQLASQQATGDYHNDSINKAVAQSLALLDILGAQYQKSLSQSMIALDAATAAVSLDSIGSNIFTTTQLTITSQASNFAQTIFSNVNDALTAASNAYAQSITQIQSPNNSAQSPQYYTDALVLQIEAQNKAAKIAAASDAAILTASSNLQSALIAQQIAFNIYELTSSWAASNIANLTQAVTATSQQSNQSSVQANLSAQISNLSVTYLNQTMISMRTTLKLANQKVAQSSSQCKVATSRASVADQAYQAFFNQLTTDNTQAILSTECNYTKTQVTLRQKLKSVACLP